MLNLILGNAVTVDGRSCIATNPGVAGHAVYGPYEQREAGKYVVEFPIESRDGQPIERNALCAVLDVTSSGGNVLHARKEIFAADLQNGRANFTLPFQLPKRAALEYRVWVSGALPLVIGDHRRVVQTTGAPITAEALLAQASFPDLDGENLPFFRENSDYFRSLYERDCGVRIEQDAVVLTIQGVSFYARSKDDLNFIGEIFFEHAYNFKSDADWCVIDIGMNIGLSTLLFAGKSEVREVHSFEPFRGTYDRAVANIGLNAPVAAKVQAHNFGLADKDWDGEILINQSSDSGAMTTVGAAVGTPIRISLKDAGGVLGPIIERARAGNLDILVKMDCEGSEFAIFDSLIAADLIRHISGFMVEWHAMFDDKTQDDLIRPLRKAGFVVFDRSPPVGNGFFYAARLREGS